MLQKQGERAPVWSPVKPSEIFWPSAVGPKELCRFKTGEAAEQGNSGVYVNFLINRSFAYAMIRKMTVMQKRATMFSHIAQLVGGIPWLHRYASPKHLQKSTGQKLTLVCGASLRVVTFTPVPQRFFYPQLCQTGDRYRVTL